MILNAAHYGRPRQTLSWWKNGITTLNSIYVDIVVMECNMINRSLNNLCPNGQRTKSFKNIRVSYVYFKINVHIRRENIY